MTVGAKDQTTSLHCDLSHEVLTRDMHLAILLGSMQGASDHRFGAARGPRGIHGKEVLVPGQCRWFSSELASAF